MTQLMAMKQEEIEQRKLASFSILDPNNGAQVAVKRPLELPIEVEQFVLRKSEIAVIPLFIQATLKREQSNISQLILQNPT